MTEGTSPDDLERRLTASGHKLTPQRVLILAALRRRRSTVTAQELFEELRPVNRNLGRATVFRNLDALVDIGLARRFERPGHVYAYTACSADHHHHLLCSSCHRAIEIDEALIAPLARDIEMTHGFHVEHGALDFYGICSRCGGGGAPGQ